MATDIKKDAKLIKRERFVRVAEGRTNKILDMIRSLAKLSDTRSYDYTDDQVEQIFSALYAELDNQRSRFTEGTSKKFKLEERHN